MTQEISKTYEPAQIESETMKAWLEAKAFAATPDARPPERRYVIMMPLPNVTGALHMGHAMDNVMQDLLIRRRRMNGDNSLWQPGTDHAGIATQAVVEKRLFELEGKTRHDIGREALVKRIQDWKDEYRARIVRQQQRMGCSCDWDRQRFTMDPVCSAAVREAFFGMFRDGLIFRGKRLVNWDCQLQTAISDDEIYHETVNGHFWYLRYPVIDPKPGEPDHVVVATTRPETMLGDTAVATHPDPEGELNRLIEEARAKAAESPEAKEELDRLIERKKEFLPRLLALAAMARDGRKVMLPLMDKPIPLIADVWAKPELGSGCVKITPGHDPNDYDVWKRHQDEIDIVNILNDNGTLNANACAYAGMDRMAARDRVLKDLEARGLVEKIEDREIEMGFSDRSKTAIEPYLSKQWFADMSDREGGIVFGRGTKNEFRSPGLAQAAIDAVDEKWSSPGGHRLAFHPERYRQVYVSWLSEKRDWCISRQLWWGHQIPVWAMMKDSAADAAAIVAKLPKNDDRACALVLDGSGARHPADAALDKLSGPFEIQVCLCNEKAKEKHAAHLEALGLSRDPDVLDTWFSSALWPFSTLGWPDPAGAKVDPGQTSLGPNPNGPGAFPYYYPGSCLVTARDIITLWVARMVIMGLYFHGDVPFTDCFVHAKILDGKGVTMSKSKGNGIDPIDIINRYGADAMRYVICDLETGMQDIRLPVQAECPHCKHVVELAEAKHGRTIFTYLCTKCGGEFDVLGTMADIKPATVTSDRFEVGRAFCNKLWNAARFMLMNLKDPAKPPADLSKLEPEDRWILSRLSHAIRKVGENIDAYKPSAALTAARTFFWDELCDWYLEWIKPRMYDPARAPLAGQVLALCMDQTLRLLHPFVPFITEALWASLAEQAPVRGVDREVPDSKLCVLAAWPEPRAEWEDDAIEAEFEAVKSVVGRLRELRSRHQAPPRDPLPAALKGPADELAVLVKHERLVKDLAYISELAIGPDVQPPKNSAAQVYGGIEIFLGGVLDQEKEKARLEKQIEKIGKDLEKTQRKLGDEKFLGKAPPEVVNKEKAKAAEMETQLAILKKALEQLAAA